MRLCIGLFLGWSIALSSTGYCQTFKTSQWQTTNGAHVVFHQAMEVPMLNLSVAFAAGSAYDGDQFGLSALTTRLLNQGNSGLNATHIAERLAQTGASFNADNNQDMVVLSLKTLTDPASLKDAVNIFSLIVNHPDFPEPAFLRSKNQQFMIIAQELESPDEVANQNFFKALYQKHPYAHSKNGTRDSVQSIQLAAVKQFYKQLFVGNNEVIVMVGAIDEATARKLSNELTKDMPRGQAAPPIPHALPLSAEMNIEIEFPASQTFLRLGQLGIDHHNKHYFPLLVGNYSLGGGSLVSRLAHEVREKRGLTYGVYSQIQAMPGIGPFIISLSTKNDQAKTAIEVCRQALESFVSTGPEEAELASAKQYLTGSFPLSLASNSSIAAMLLKIVFYHLPSNFLDTYVDRVNAVTALEIKDAFQQLIVPQKLLQVTVGKQ